MNEDYSRPLDGLRAIAVLLVVFFHAGWLRFGWIGVQIFFVLSGYLITRGLLQERRDSFGNYLKRFYGRRALRIFPLYYGYLLLIALAATLIALPGDLFGALPYLATYTFNFTRLGEGYVSSPFYTHLWSLCVEEQFYLTWPLLVYFLSPVGLRRSVIALLIAVPLLRWALAGWALAGGYDPWVSGDFVYWVSLSHFDAFACGGAIALFDLSKRVSRPGLVATVAVCLCIGAGIVHLSSATAPPLVAATLGYPLAGVQNLQPVWSYTLLNGATVAVMVLLLAKPGGVLGRILSTAPAVEIGRISYGVYVLHWPLMWLMHYLRKQAGLPLAVSQSPAFVLLWVVVVLLVAWASYYGFERRFLAIKNRWFPHATRAVEAAAS